MQRFGLPGEAFADDGDLFETSGWVGAHGKRAYEGFILEGTSIDTEGEPREGYHMKNRSDSAAKATRSTSTSDLKRGMGIWVWSRRPAKIVQSFRDGTYEVEYVGDETVTNRIDRNDLDPMDQEERTQYLPKPRLEPDYLETGDAKRTPLRKFMDEWPISRAQMVKLLNFSPPKVDRLIADSILPLNVAVLLAIIFEVVIDPNVLPEKERPFLDEALNAAKEGAAEVQQDNE
jgi:hypothetical protein